MFGRKTNLKARTRRPNSRTKKAASKAKAQRDYYDAQTAKYKSQIEANRQRQTRNLESRNPIRRKIAQQKQTSMKKQEVKMRKLESEAQLAEQDPKLQAKKAEADNKISVERARYRSKTASATALAAGMASLGRGLSDENNQDDEANRKSQEQIIKTIFQPEDSGPDSGNTGLTEGVE